MNLIKLHVKRQIKCMSRRRWNAAVVQRNVEKYYLGRKIKNKKYFSDTVFKLFVLFSICVTYIWYK